MQPGAALQQVIHQRRGLDYVLEVVQHQQQVPVLQGGAHLHARRRRAADAQTQRLDDGRGHLAGVGQRPQAHKDGTVFELAEEMLGDSQSQPGLADAGWPNQGDQPGAVADQPPLHGGDILGASKQRRQLSWQVVRSMRPGAAHGGRVLAAGAQRKADEFGLIGVRNPRMPDQRRRQLRRWLQIARFDLAQRHVGAAGATRHLLLRPAQQFALLFEPLAEVVAAVHGTLSQAYLVALVSGRILPDCMPGTLGTTVARGKARLVSESDTNLIEFGGATLATSDKIKWLSAYLDFRLLLVLDRCFGSDYEYEYRCADYEYEYRDREDALQKICHLDYAHG